MADRFVCVHNRDRDGYQVALALYEAGLLDRLVTDFYAPAHGRWTPRPLRRRRVEGLPGARVTGAPLAFAIQAAAHALRLPMARVFALTDALLARKASQVAGRTRAGLYAYAGYLPVEDAIAPATPRIVFEFHPPPGLGRELLRADTARFPSVRRSWERELAGMARAGANPAWVRADAVVCASAMTRASLEHAGCDPARITVIPYGADPLASPPRPRAPTGRAEFLFVGQGVQRKGLHHLIAAWQAADLADARLTLVCYAIDPGIADLIRSPSIRLLPRQSPAALAALYAAGDVFAMPSLVEGFGLVYLEALARGCHVLGTPNTGLPDLRLPADAATLTPPGDLDALAAALTALRDRARAGTLDRAAIARAGTAWRWADFRAAIAAHAADVLAG